MRCMFPQSFKQFETVSFDIMLLHSDGTGGILDNVKDVKVTLTQAGVTLTKEMADLGIDAEKNTITVYLTQEDTGLFATMPCEIQANVMYEDGERDTSTIGKIMVEKNLYREVME